MIGWYRGNDIGPIAQTQPGTAIGVLPFIRNAPFVMQQLRPSDSPPVLRKLRTGSASTVLQRLRMIAARLSR